MYNNTPSASGGTVWQYTGPDPMRLRMSGLGLPSPLSLIESPSLGESVSFYSPGSVTTEQIRAIKTDRWMGVQDEPSDNPSLLRQSVYVYRVGFPFRSHECRVDTDVSNDGIVTIRTIGVAQVDKKLLPLGLSRLFSSVVFRPIWLGFLLNVVIYGGLVWILKKLIIDRILIYRRRRISNRKSNRLCIQCGYSVHGVSRCPECGLDIES